ncbi:MAG TPA: DNA recombination/repair protein RecA, partial [Clostridiales bacterium]|nr:DNA recombination/repair protein RecA [Clostridiales bacterium]
MQKDNLNDVSNKIEDVLKDVKRTFGSGSIMRLGDRPCVDVDA